MHHALSTGGSGLRQAEAGCELSQARLQHPAVLRGTRRWGAQLALAARSTHVLSGSQ